LKKGEKLIDQRVIHSFLDVPTKHSEYYNDDWVFFSGWAFSTKSMITKVEVYVNDHHWGYLASGIKRDDVAAIYQEKYPNIFFDGFRGSLPLKDFPVLIGDPIIRVVIQDADGNQETARCPIRVRKRDNYSFGEHLSQERRRIVSYPFAFFLDEPVSQLPDAKMAINIIGWVISSKAPIVSVKVMAGSFELKSIAYGFKRNEIIEAGFGDDPNCGFMGKLTSAEIPIELRGQQIDLSILALDASGNKLAYDFSIHSLQSVRQFCGGSIIIPVFNGLEDTQACVESIYQSKTDIPFEIIVVNNGSTDDTANWLKIMALQHNNFKYINLSENHGFAKAVNRGIQVTGGRYVVILNNDTLVTPGWLDRLVAAAESDVEIAIVSPMTNYVGEGPQIDSDAIDILPDGIDAYSEKIKNRKSPVIIPDRLVFFCVLIKRHILDILGGLDEGFFCGNFEDDEFCLRTRLLGFKLALSTNAFVFHHGSKTFSENKIPHSEFMNSNRSHFLRKLSNLSSNTYPYIPARKMDRVSTTHPVISVIVRTQDQHDLLWMALTSLANQTFSNFEVILINDGGPRLSNQLSEFEKYFPINFVHHDVQKGRAPALNKGLEVARGDYITQLDDDDILYPLHLEILWSTIQNNHRQHDIIYTDCCQAFLTEKSRNGVVEKYRPWYSWDFKLSELKVNNYIPIHCWIQSRKASEEIGPFDERLDALEDWEFLIRASGRYTFLHVPKITCEYRFFLDGSNSVTNFQAMMAAYDMVCQLYPSDPAIETKRQEVKIIKKKQYFDLEQLQKCGDPNSEIYHNKMLKLMYNL